MEQFTVFVYGTLKRNEPNHHYLASSTFVNTATTATKFPLVIASKYNIPFAIDKPGLGNVGYINFFFFMYVCHIWNFTNFYLNVFLRSAESET